MFNLFKKKNKTCPRCGVDLSLLRKSELVRIDGQIYCNTCVQNMEREKSAPEFSCFACGERFPNTEAESVCGQRLCHQCAGKYFAGKLPGLFAPNEPAAPTALPNQPGTYPLPQLYQALLASGRVNTEPIYGTALKQAIYQYKAAYHAMEQSPRREGGDTPLPALMFHLITAMEKTPLLIPFRYGDEQPGGEEDRTLHLTQAAANRVNADAIVQHCRRLTAEQLNSLYWTCGEGGQPTPDLAYWDMGRFSGSAGYSFPGNDDPAGGTMYFATVNAGNSTFLPLFTDLDLVRNLLKGQQVYTHIAVVAAPDIRAALRGMSSVTGVLINPDTESHCFLSRIALLGDDQRAK